MRELLLEAFKKLDSAVEAAVLDDGWPDPEKIEQIWPHLQALVELGDLFPTPLQELYRRLVESFMRETQLWLDCLALQKRWFDAGDLDLWRFYSEMAIKSALACRNLRERLYALSIVAERHDQAREEMAA